ncbi:MAG: hypothetical protein ABR557_02980, partial [Pyrinomonadaceae bacterium]
MSDRLTTAAANTSKNNRKQPHAFAILICLVAVLGTCVALMGQAGRKPATNSQGGLLVNVVAKRADNLRI